MTSTNDPQHPQYLDEASVRDEMTRVFDICRECRRCESYCVTFPTLFELIDGRRDGDAGSLTPAEQDHVVGTCFQCKQCVVGCPAAAGSGVIAEVAQASQAAQDTVDVPRLMIRATAMQRSVGIPTLRSRLTTQVLCRTELFGRFGTRFSGPVNRVVTRRPGSFGRRLLSRLTGLSSQRRLMPFAEERFSTWFRSRPKIRLGDRQGSATIFPTCVVEYRAPEIGQDLVKVYERNGIECTITEARCCGAPWLHSGDIGRFAAIAERNVVVLAGEVRAGRDIVVPEPSCLFVIQQDYPNHVRNAARRADAALVAANTHDSVDHLMRIHRADDTVLDTAFHGAGTRPQSMNRITVHGSGPLAALDVGFEARDLLELTGARVGLVHAASGVESQQGLRSDRDTTTTSMAERLGPAIAAEPGDVVVGDCHLSNILIEEQTTIVVHHPLQVMAWAYGLTDEPLVGITGEPGE